MVLIKEKPDGRVSFTKDGRVNLVKDQYPDIHLAITALLSLNQPNEQLRKGFHSVLPDFSSVTDLQEKTITKVADTVEDNLRTLGFIKINKNKSHDLRNKLVEISEFETRKRHNPILIETKLISAWLNFLQKKVEEKKDLSSLNYLILVSMIQTNYLDQTERLITQILKNPGTLYKDLKETHELLKTISDLMFHPHILYSQPFKTAAKILKKEINNIEDPGTLGYDHEYRPAIERTIQNCLTYIKIKKAFNKDL